MFVFIFNLRTARVWENFQCTSILKGHSSAIWSIIALSNGNLVTGSADKTIKIWQKDQCIVTLTGHTDVVRQLTILPFSGFASCSNDGTIRLWSEDGQCLRELAGHRAFIYSLTALSSGILVSGGEDHFLRLWKDAECIQCIQYPAQSVWSIHVVMSQNIKDDIIIGGNDGILRIFTSIMSRTANGSELKSYQESITALKIHE